MPGGGNRSRRKKSAIPRQEKPENSYLWKRKTQPRPEPYPPKTTANAYGDKITGKTSFGTLSEAFGQAFADYEVQLDKTQLRRMLRRRGFDPRLSFAAFDGERIAAFTLNGIGNFNGLPTAYDTGTGTLEAYRGQRLAAKVFEHSIPYLREAGIRQYLLEVLQHNTKAVSVYRKLGFETAREFNYSIQQGAHVHLGAKIPDIACTVMPVDVGRFAPDPQFWDFMPSWQNSPEAIRRAAGTSPG